MWSGDHPSLQNWRTAGNPVAGGFDSHSLPPISRMDVWCWLSAGMIRLSANGLGGALELGETVTDAVRREVLEETTLVVEPVSLLNAYESRNPG